MTQVLSKLASMNRPDAATKINRLAMASSAAALAYWTYLLIRPQRRGISNQCDQNNKRRNSSRDVSQYSKPMKTSKKSSNSVSRDITQQQTVLFLDKKTINEKKKKRKINYRDTIKNLKIIFRFIMGYRELMLACGVSMGLIMRTLLDLWNIKISTQIESAIITANGDLLTYSLVSFGAIAPTLAFVNNIIKYFSDRLRLRLRYNLSKVLYERYMNNLTFYQLSQSGDQFQNVDQLLTADVDKFCSSMVEVYNNLSKPFLDIILLVHGMAKSHIGIQTPAIMISWLALVGSILTKARQPLAAYIISETQSEGQLRFIHSRLIQNSEEVAFYKGQHKERNTLLVALAKLRESYEDSILFKFKIGMMDNIVGRYSSTIVAYLALARPFFSKSNGLAESDDRLTHYYISGRMMMKLAESITRIILAGQDLSKLAAYTQRVHTLLSSMDKLNGGQICRSTIDTEQQKNTGTVEICNDDETQVIEFDGVTLSAPSGDLLVKNLTFSIKPGQSVIIAGPNGCGKSSLFRVLGGLWWIETGRVLRPPSDQLFYICQKPYMTLGTLRDQVIFPDVTSKFSDEQLIEILGIVELTYLIEQDRHTFDSINDWQDVLSGGEKQRMALARLVYHKPKFAILDECTSAVAIDVEQRIYEYLSKELNCTLLSVTHRVKQLAKFHQLLLAFDGEGSYEFTRLVHQV